MRYVILSATPNKETRRQYNNQFYCTSNMQPITQ